MNRITIALAGNPNSGKTTVFNALTGARQYVGNWPGVTVERIEGRYSHHNVNVRVVDLPGIYSFSAYSPDESIARKYILYEKPAVVVNVVDATNLKRNLYLTTQLLEIKTPVVVALNMMDVARQQNLRIEPEHLARHLDCPVVPLVATRKEGLDELKDAVERVAREHTIPATNVDYDSVVEEALRTLLPACRELAAEKRVHPRWLAIKLLESDELAHEISGGRLDKLVEEQTRKIAKHVGEDARLVLADGRFGFIHGLARDILHRDETIRRTVSDKIDRVALNRWLGAPFFLAVMFLIVLGTLYVGEPFIRFFDRLCGTIFVDGFGHLLANWHTPPWLIALLADGLGGGVRTVATFIPPIFFIFLFLSILEDSGYMARAAFVMDRLLRWIGLPGRAFLPMLVGFGCTVPAILATRTLQNPRDRILTVLLTPFASCGARLPVYTLFAAAFFPGRSGLLVFSLYLTGIALAVLTGLALRTTLFRSEPSTFVMELPPYHVPTLDGIFFHTWRRLKGFILRAGKVILLAVVVLNMLNSVEIRPDGQWGIGHEPSPHSLLSRVGQSVTPAFKPMGIEEKNWPATVGLFAGLLAKEVVIGALDALYVQMDNPQAPAMKDSPTPPKKEFDFRAGVLDAFRAIHQGFVRREDAPSRDDLAGTLVRHFPGKASALAYLLFVLIYSPCIAAVAAIYRETNIRWMAFSVLYTTALAWLVATLFYQSCTLTDHPARSATWLGVCLAILVGGYLALRLAGRAWGRTGWFRE
jgi:ferrous iron transport protein B